MAADLGLNRQRVRKPMRLMVWQAISLMPRTTRRVTEHRIDPYLPRNMAITRLDQVWSRDIIYIPLTTGYLYLTAVLEWYSRHVLAWRLSRNLESVFCCQALDELLAISQPETFNTDQGVSFTRETFMVRLKEHGIAISLIGRGRCLDNAFVRRLW